MTLENKVQDTLNKASNITNAAEEVLQNQYLQSALGMLSEISTSQDVINFVRGYKPWMPDQPSYTKCMAYINKNMKMRKKRKFGLITLSQRIRAGKKSMDQWLQMTSTIGNVIYTPIDWHQKTELEQALILTHEINHHILEKQIGKVKYKVLYLSNEYFRLAIELACYKTNYHYKLTDEMRRDYIKSLIVKFESSYEIKLSTLSLHHIVNASLK